MAVLRNIRIPSEEALRPTYGVILYQEQVMEIAGQWQVSTLGSADILRRAMGKKNQKKWLRSEKHFDWGGKKGCRALRQILFSI